MRVRDSQGAESRVKESSLRGPLGQTLARLPAYRVYLFGWLAAYLATRLVK